LWSADLTKKIDILDENNEKILFDLVSAWEVIEHIAPNDLDFFFNQIQTFLKPNGLFIASINTGHDCRRDENNNLITLHQSVFKKKYWEDKILKNKKIIKYPFKNYVRKMNDSFYIGLIR
jgi:cyclopropane fatty-acyl-phospholipid synthase-like methyltransferase